MNMDGKNQESSAEIPKKKQAFAMAEHPRFKALATSVELPLPLLSLVFAYEHSPVYFCIDNELEARDVLQFSEDRRRAVARPGPNLIVGDVSLPLGGYMDWTFDVKENFNYSCGIISEAGIRDTRGLHDSTVNALGVRNFALDGRMPEAYLQDKRVRVCVEDNKVYIFAAGELVFESDIPPDWFPVRLGINCFRGAVITLYD